jgi:hypothetical protein
MKILKKSIKIAVISLIAIVLAVVLFAVGYIVFEPVVFGKFYADSQKEFATPGIKDGFTPQGLAFAEENQVFLSAGYMKDHTKPSRIYITSGYENKDWSSRYITLSYEDGKAYTGHGGGIAVYNDFVYVTGVEIGAKIEGKGNMGEILVFEYDDIIAAESGSDIKAVYRFNSQGQAAACLVHEDTLYVGEFYQNKTKDDEFKSRTTPAGDEHRALIYSYALSADAPFGLAGEITQIEGESDRLAPKAVFSAPYQNQGMAITKNGKFVISTSYSVAGSHLLIYNMPQESDTPISVAPSGIPVYYLDSSTLDKDILAAPMAEGLAYVDGRLFVLNESASDKYIFGKVLRANNVYSIPLE